MEDEVVFAEPARIRLDHGCRGALEALAHDGLNARGKIHVPNPAAGERDEAFPIAGKTELVDDADHAVVVILDFALEAFAAAQHEGIERLSDRRPLVTHIGRDRMLDGWLRHGARFHDLLQPVEPDLLAHIELDQDKDRSRDGF